MALRLLKREQTASSSTGVILSYNHEALDRYIVEVTKDWKFTEELTREDIHKLMVDFLWNLGIL